MARIATWMGRGGAVRGGIGAVLALAVGCGAASAEPMSPGCVPPPSLAMPAGGALHPDLAHLPEPDPVALTQAIAAERPDSPPPVGVTGITVPHHLLAPDLIARGFWAASAGSYDRIILLAPDHHGLVGEGAATARGCVETVFGRVPLDPAGAARLLAEGGPFSTHPDLAREHGVTSLLPFAARFFPGTPVLPVVTSMRAGAEDWAEMAEHLAPLLTGRTLVVQSTDYVHFLDAAAAALRDQETLGVLATGDPARVALLRQPDHLDATGAQAIMLALQARMGPARGVVVANRTSADYGGAPDDITSYIVSVFHRDPAVLSGFRYDDHAVIHLAGDVMLGRFMLPVLGDAEAQARILNAVRVHTGGAPVLANLEGVVLPGAVVGAPPRAHVMPAEVALSLLGGMGVAAAGLANNHAWDLGPDGLAATRVALEDAGIAALGHGEVADLGPVRVVALNLVSHRGPTASEAEIEAACRTDARPPVIAFLHWGAEYTPLPGPGETALAERLAACGFAAVVGTHSHQASAEVELAGGRMPWVYSTGNFLFDQRSDRASGALVEVRVFERGTMALRLLPIPNLFEMGAHWRP
ncbi:AmmeMemoRadiSam system protein B [Roseibacterium sp. SDUM158016]|uniref:AmmeMemoRadiSam system protein B n=1 Tax=Roseicyclus sediminis TaxID=2980997 RepID=UPI0021D32E93|nr:AmmeMemoRadiSam system protein B [Roseibacterium sp. SDUM158016]MCU4653064.1 AmmeMemoRadiSam system protein B [Roseibacterium sp. SDUM158016]